MLYKVPKTKKEYKLNKYTYKVLETLKLGIKTEIAKNNRYFIAIPANEINTLHDYVTNLFQIKTILLNNKLTLTDLEEDLTYILTLIKIDKATEEISDIELEIDIKNQQELEELTMLINSSKNHEREKLNDINDVLIIFNKIPDTYFNKLILFDHDLKYRQEINSLKSRIQQRIEKFENILRIIYTREKELLQAINEDNSHLRQPSRLQSITPIYGKKSVSRTPSRLQSITPINEDITQDKEEEPYYRLNKAGGFKKKVKQLKKYLKESNKSKIRRLKFK